MRPLCDCTNRLQHTPSWNRQPTPRGPRLVLPPRLVSPFDTRPPSVSMTTTRSSLPFATPFGCRITPASAVRYKTLKNYKQVLIALIRYVGNKPLDKLTKPEYQKYLLFLKDKKRLGSATLNVHINGYKFYCEKILEREKDFYDIAYPRMPVKLPTVYSIAEVEALFNATTSLKYRTLFRLVYATGLRLSEVAHLKLTDLDRVRRLVHVRGGKGKKDRIVMLGEKLETYLNEYLTYYKSKTYILKMRKTTNRCKTGLFNWYIVIRFVLRVFRNGVVSILYDTVLLRIYWNQVWTSAIFRSWWVTKVF